MSSDSDSDFDDAPLIPACSNGVKKEDPPTSSVKSNGSSAKTEEGDSDSGSDFDDIPLVEKKGEQKEVKIKKEEMELASDSDFDDAPLVSNPVTKKRKREASDSDSDFDDVPLVEKKIKKVEKKPKKPKKEKKPQKINKAKPQKRKAEQKTSNSSKRAKKEDDGLSVEERREKKRLEKLQAELPTNRYWEDDAVLPPQGHNWITLTHNGPMFPEPYKPHGVKLLYDGKPVDLSPEQEELATFFATYLETQHNEKKAFRDNFFKEFKTLLNKDRKKKDLHFIKDFKKCDFTPIHAHIMRERERKKAMSKEEKDKIKEKNKQMQEHYGFAVIDNDREAINNWKVEPPGLFLGRGNHPRTGSVKQRIVPEDVTINVSKGAPVPKPPEGHKWREVVHDPTVSWLATWKDDVSGIKYVKFAPGSRIQGLSDMRKFEVARALHKHIDKIRKHYNKMLVSGKATQKQMATALYFIDKLALRVGNEKSEDEADTVGCCSLRVEHVELKEPDIVCFDFLGKDSMRYRNEVKVTPAVYSCVQKFKKGKNKGEDLFDRLSPSTLNAHLKAQMPGLTVKVFRTYNASITLERLLEKTPDDLVTPDEKVLFFNRANRQVAILCNHQRTLPKTFNESLQRLEDKIKEVKKKRKDVQKRLKKVKAGENPDRVAGDPPNDVEKIKKALVKLDQRIKKLEISKTEKMEGKEFSSSTSKLNYIDPRIITSWCKRYGCPIEKIFSKGVRKKFPWAMEQKPDFKFSNITKRTLENARIAAEIKSNKSHKSRR